MTPPRLLVVSAHFPPNFVSGGTLVPERQARGFQRRGWDVSVYAGHLQAGAEPYAARDELLNGLPVRWIEVGDFASWSDRRNFDNPTVALDFATVIERFAPDVVHFHSLQCLGAGLLPVAAASGARVALTMHDFWWCCARQFLVDRTWVPCSLVVSAGVCACEVDASWLSARNGWLSEQLKHADLILAPSAVAADVLAANGVPLDRLEVDENGLLSVPPPPEHRQNDDIRFRYTGGADQMKGAGVLRSAAVHLATQVASGWQLVAHGDPTSMRALGAWPDQVRLEAPYPPRRLDEVMAETDVLVVPSLMRESHSLVTREALLRGVPVICSDSLGPETVVQPGRNGSVVPTGDPALLAEAMARLVREPHEVERLSAAAAAVPVRLEADHVDELSDRLAQLVAVGSPADEMPTGPIRRVAFVCGIDGAPLRYRAHLPAEGLALQGVHADVVYYRDPSATDLAMRADAVVFYRVPATRQVLELIDTLHAEHPATPLLFDVDDLIFDPDLKDEIPALRILPMAEAALWLDGVCRYRTTMEACDAFVGSTRLLCEHAEAVTGLRAHQFDNGVGMVLGQASDAELRRPRRPGPLRVGYFSGTTTHDHDWRHIEPAVIQVLDDHPDAQLVLGGHLNPTPALARLGSRVQRLPMLDWRELPGALRDLDVNLAPLEPFGRFNEAKSAIKWLEAALVATPTIATPTQPFIDSIRHGVNGLLATSPEEWEAALRGLLSDDGLRSRLGSRARRDALLRWPPHLQGARYLAILESARADLAHLRSARTSSWVPLAPDEPPVPSPLQPYAHADKWWVHPPETAVIRRLRAGAARRVSATARRFRENGLRAAGRAALRGAAADSRRLVARVRRLRSR